MALPLGQGGTLTAPCFKESCEFSRLQKCPHLLTLKAQGQGVRKCQDEAPLAGHLWPVFPALRLQPAPVLPLTEISDKERCFPGQWGSRISALKGLARSVLACSADPKRPCQNADQVPLWSGWVSEGAQRHTLRDLRGICLNRVRRGMAEPTINTTQDRDEVTET